MQELERTINICHTAFIVFLILTIVFLVVSVIFFFWFNIRGIYDMRTGRGARKTIQKMQELNDQTGKLREDIVTNTPVSLSSENRIVTPSMEETGSERTERVSQAQNAGGRRLSQSPQDGNSYAEGAQKTTLLRGDGAQATTLLGGEGSQETTLLGGEGAQETTLLRGEGSQETALLGGEGIPGRAALTEDSPYGETTVLAAGEIRDNPHPGKKINLPGAFKIEKEIMWIHTEEML